MFWIRFTGMVWVLFFVLAFIYEYILFPSGLVETKLRLGDPTAGLDVMWYYLLVLLGIPLIVIGRIGNPVLERFFEKASEVLSHVPDDVKRRAAERDSNFSRPVALRPKGGSTRSDRNVRRSTTTRNRNVGSRVSETSPPFRMKTIEDTERRFSIEVPAHWDEVFSFAENDHYGVLDNSSGFGMVSIKRDEPEDLEEEVTTLSKYADYCVEDLLEDEEEISREPIITAQGLVALRIETRMYSKPSSLKLMYLADDLTGLYVDYSLVGDEDGLRQMADYSFSTFRDAFDL